MLITLALMEFYNDYFDWWYVAVLIILYTPLLIAVYFFLMWLSASKRDKVTAIDKLPLACWLIITSLVLTELWLIIYIVYLYKYQEVYTGF